jgi:chemotaxis protein MotB
MRPDDAGLSPVGGGDDDQFGWLVTFSDLVLQLFAFVVVAVVIGGQGIVAEAPHDVASEPIRVARPSMLVADAWAAPPEPPRRAARASAPPAVAAAARREVGTAHVDTPPPALTRANEQLQAFVATSGLADEATVAIDDTALVLTLGESIGFASGSADVPAGARALVHELRVLASSMPDYGVDVAGHTDDTPIHGGAYPSNLELSLARAASVAEILIDEDPALSARTVATGFGEHRPVATNHEPTGRARNRRVELRLVPIDRADD